MLGRPVTAVTVEEEMGASHRSGGVLGLSKQGGGRKDPLWPHPPPAYPDPPGPLPIAPETRRSASIAGDPHIPES